MPTAGITLTDGADTIVFPAGAHWKDRDQWQSVNATVDYTVDGALRIQEWETDDGRPITLGSVNNNCGLLSSYGDDAMLRAWLATPGKTMTLSVWGETYTVSFRLQDVPAYTSTQLWEAVAGIPAPADEQLDTYLVWELKLQTVTL